jgi:hypothetical protein
MRASRGVFQYVVEQRGDSTGLVTKALHTRKEMQGSAVLSRWPRCAGAAGVITSSIMASPRTRYGPANA